MITVTALPGTALPDDVVAVGVPVLATSDGPRVAGGQATFEGIDLGGIAPGGALDADWCERQGFSGKVAQTLDLRSLGGGPDVVLVGLGPMDALAGDAGLESVRRSAAGFVRAAGSTGAAVLALCEVSGTGPTEVATAAAEAGALASYRYDDFRSSDPPTGLAGLALAAPSPSDVDAVGEGAAHGSRVARAVAFARDLVNEPPSSLTPERFADVVADRFAGVEGLTVEVWDLERIGSERLGGLLGVAAGSVRPPRLVKVVYRPTDPYEFDGREPHLALVGKGITFDSGGLSLKPPASMETMKTDMGGAAAVLAAVDAIAALGGRIPITAWTPMTENMPSGSATKPGDVLTTRSGKTIEVLNTDAEGSLILADGLTLAVESEPDAVIDLATLTGAAIVALGKEIAGLLGNDEGLREAVLTAAAAAGEPAWPLPLYEDYGPHIESEIADMKNMGRPGQAGTIAAALLLAEFVGDVPWAHLDIAGPSRTDDNRWYNTKGGSGFGVRTLVALGTSETFARWLAGRRGD